MKRDVSSTDALMKTLRLQCAQLPGAEEYVMVHHPAFRVGKKPFVIAGMASKDDPAATLSINLGPMMQGELLDDERFARTPYIGQHGWVTVRAKDTTPLELQRLVEESWRRIAGAKHLRAKDGAAPSLAKPPTVKRTRSVAKNTRTKNSASPKAPAVKNTKSRKS